MPAMPGAAGVSEGPADTRKHIPVETACYVFKAAVWPQSRAIVRIVCELLMVWCTHSHWVRETSLSIKQAGRGTAPRSPRRQRRPMDGRAPLAQLDVLQVLRERVDKEPVRKRATAAGVMN